MDNKRLKDIIWEHDNDYEKFKLHAAEYFKEILPIVKKGLGTNAREIPTDVDVNDNTVVEPGAKDIHKGYPDNKAPYKKR